MIHASKGNVVFACTDLESKLYLQIEYIKHMSVTPSDICDM